MATGTRTPGEFCWVNMLTSRPAEAREFYSKLLGWTYTEMPGNMGHAIKVGGRDVGGLFDLEGPNTPPGTLPHIGVMVKVENADATCAKIASLRGKALPAFDVMDAGRMAVCFDPNGAAFDIWEPKKMQGTDVDSGLHGAPSWSETITTDVSRAKEFYAKLFGWTPEIMPMPAFDYTTFSLRGAPVAGMMPILPDMAGMKPHWGTYFTVKDVDETARQTPKLGGTICMPLMDIPEVGRMCGIISPQGVMFYAITYLPRV